MWTESDRREPEGLSETHLTMYDGVRWTRQMIHHYQQTTVSE